MQRDLSNDYNNLRVIYYQITKGYSYDPSSKLYVRHFTESDIAESLLYKDSLKEEYQKSGLETREKRLELAIESGEWSKEKDEKIIELEYIIKDNEKFLSTMVLESQKQEVIKILKEKKIELSLLRLEKNKAIGYNSDDLAEKESGHMFIKTNVYKDLNFTNPVISDVNDLRDMEESELEIYVGALNKYISSIRERDIRAIACLPFFLNRFSPCRERPEAFFNRGMAELTNHQLNLILTGSRNVTVLVESEGEPPEIMDDVKIDDIVDWYDKQYSQIQSKAKGGGITKTEKTVVNRGK